MTSHPKVFLNGERCQVWALHRDTGEPRYIEVGEADSLRPYAKKHLRCPYPGCDVEISTRGGSRRDHYFHPNTTPHETEPESESHLAAKAMIAQWLAGVVPDGATVQVEQTVKDPNSALHRRPDVIATGRTGAQVAYEVEYKAWAVDDWRKKQEDLDAASITTLWLIGHTRVRPAKAIGCAANEVVLPELAAAIARAGKPVVLVNPVTREIGTLTDSTGAAWYDGSGHAWLHIDPLDECRFSARHGIRTPSMLPIEAAERQQAEVEDQRQQYRIAWAALWEASPLRQTFIDRWGSIPEDLAMTKGSNEGAWQGTSPAIEAADPLWRALIYEDLVHKKTEPFGLVAAAEALEKNGIGFDRRAADAPINAWLLHLAAAGLIKTVGFADRYRLTSRPFHPTGHQIGDQLDVPELTLVEKRKRAAAARVADRESRARTKLVIDTDGKRRWVPK